MEPLRRHVRRSLGKPGVTVEDTTELRWDELVVHPESRFKLSIMLVTLILLVYILVAVPFVIGFEIDILDESIAWARFELFVDCAFCAVASNSCPRFCPSAGERALIRPRPHPLSLFLGGHPHQLPHGYRPR